MYAVYVTATGELVSIGSILADPMPSHLTVLELDPAVGQSMLQGTHRWNATTRQSEPTPPDPVIVVTQDIYNKAQVALGENVTALEQLPTARTAMQTVLTNGQAVINAGVTSFAQANTQIDNLAAEVRRLANVVDAMLVAQARALRVDNQMIRLLVPGLLVENTDT